MKKTATRREFITLSALTLGGLNNKASAGANQPVKPLKIICAGAHPGDPEFGCGGTMAKYSAAGHKVIFLYLTRGEAFDKNISHTEAASLRTKEAATACAALKVTAVFAGQIDGDTKLGAEQNEAMLKIIESEKPDIVFTQWPMDTHPDHQVTGLLVLNAWTKMKQSFDLYFYEVNTGSETMSFVPTDYVEITNFRDKKKAAMWAHQTQDPEKTYLSFFQQMEAFRGLEAGVPAAEAFIHYRSKTDTIQQKILP